MGEMSKVEEVARAIWASGHGIPWEMADVPDRLDCLYAAKAAIAAIKGPTEAMLAAGSFAIEGLTEEDAKRLGEEEHFQSGAWQAEKVLDAMLDAALKE